MHVLVILNTAKEQRVGLKRQQTCISHGSLAPATMEADDLRVNYSGRYVLKRPVPSIAVTAVAVSYFQLVLARGREATHVFEQYRMAWGRNTHACACPERATMLESGSNYSGFTDPV